jgi:hypothetical protein
MTRENYLIFHYWDYKRILVTSAQPYCMHSLIAPLSIKIPLFFTPTFAFASGWHSHLVCCPPCNLFPCSFAGVDALRLGPITLAEPRKQLSSGTKGDEGSVIVWWTDHGSSVVCHGGTLGISPVMGVTAFPRLDNPNPNQRYLRRLFFFARSFFLLAGAMRLWLRQQG